MRKVVQVFLGGRLPIMIPPYPTHVSYQIYFLHSIQYIFVNWDGLKLLMSQLQGPEIPR